MLRSLVCSEICIRARLEHMKRVPVEGDVFQWHCFRLEVADMDNARIDKIVVSVSMPDS
ncbi:MAG: hypothetical protein K2I35_05565 [Duncaniella sp.]|nr:hypothetical protein [Duncaniella sp.]